MDLSNDKKEVLSCCRLKPRSWNHQRLNVLSREEEHTAGGSYRLWRKDLADGRNLQRNQLRNPSVSSLYSRVWTDLGSPAISLSSSRFPFLSDPHLKDKKGSSESRKWWRNGWKKMKAKEEEQYARDQQWVIVCQIHRRIPQSRVAYLFFLRILLLRL